MTETVNLTIKINPALKEQIKQRALDNQISMSQEIVQRLQESLLPPTAAEIDNQDTVEAASNAFSADEVKQLRALLKKQSKKKK
ncbi:Arc family DNA-binding protein [Candidatus Pantoea deserta]|uniref:Arc family DNA-binding protein n=1 Tax=Candidatus Pantoea deserta TaxID=1869313 RepID=A0A3N4P9A8_9GAMM|nr:Arc family DNA-binding protein [Pantoea deserta]RPE02919.1 Arc family DNA-binding protein [Pantoea deserta]